MVATSEPNRTFKFRKGTPEALQAEAIAALPLLNQFQTGASQSILQLEEGYNFLTLKANLGEAQFKRLLKTHAPLSVKDILQKLSVAELVQRVPQFYDRILSLGSEACDTLKKASDDLVARILTETSQCATTTVSVLKTLVRRESKGFAPIPTDEEKRAYSKGTLVEITKSGQIQGWIAEVISEPDNFGQLSVRLLKNCRKRNLFLHEVTVHSTVTTPDPDSIMTSADWNAIANSYVFPSNDGKYVALSDDIVQNIKELALEIARSDTDPEAIALVTRWRHAIDAIERYELVPAFAKINTPTTPTSKADGSTSLITALAKARKMKATLKEELDACVTDDARDLLRHKLRGIEREIERIIDKLCAGESDYTPTEWPNNTTAIEEKDQEIESLRSELETLREAIQQSDSALSRNTVENQALTQQVAFITQENQALTQQVAFITQENQALTQQVANLQTQLQTALSEQNQEVAQPTAAVEKLEESQKRIIQLEKLVSEYSDRQNELDELVAEYSDREIEFKKDRVGGQTILELEQFLKDNFDKRLVREISIWDALKSTSAAADTIKLLAEKLKYEMTSHTDYEELANSDISQTKKENKQLALFKL